MADPTPEQRAAAQAFAADNLSLNMADVQTALADAYGDSWQAGTLSAQSVINGLAVDWDAWEPGNLDAAIKLSDGGLQTLLDQAGQAIDGIEGTTLDRLGSLLAEGVLNGDSIDSIAASMSDFLDDPNRAYQIADTEVTRATQSASMDQYAEQGVQMADWLVSPDACDECQDYADGGPYTLDDFPDLPAHPSCRCSSSPIDPGPQGSEEA